MSGAPTMATPDPTSARSDDSATVMHTRKRNGAMATVDVNKIVRAVLRCEGGLPHVDPMQVTVKTIGGLYDGATTAELDRLSIQTAAGVIAKKPEYSRLTARLLGTYIDKEVANQDIHSFSQSNAAGYPPTNSVSRERSISARN